ncbi:Adaptive-response sensory-kinase SasA [Ralstonia mannitolilytica]|uniref:histidine kinase n=2 Tax=Ralstonia mannitolilytica TaxID=105219 RepID=A0ABM9KXQ4_9RALS|nr:Adaptive-response sensory-kinase SasA [Ralstonia mannitolilytica]
MRWPASLAGRLVLAFVVVASVTLTAAGTYLYYALNAQLRAADDAMLLGKIAQLRHLASEAASVDDLARNAHRYTDVVSGHDGLILRIAAPDGRTMVEVNPEGEAVAMPAIVPAGVAPSEPAVQTWTSMAGKEYARLSHMIEDMLFLARADHARVALATATLEARHEVQVLVDYFEAVAADRDIVIDVTGDGLVRADATLLRRALNNLLDNALRHTPTGERIDVAIETLPHATAIRVRNPGPGIPTASLPLLFERFYRGDPSRAQSGAQSSQSTGLGLAIVKTIMDLHGGSVEASSPPHGRTEFRLVFPS